MTHNMRLCGLAWLTGGCVIVAAACGSRAAATEMTPLSAGMAGSSMALSFGVDAAFDNPAQLGWPQTSRMQLRLLNIGARLSNNGFGWGDYRRYNGANLNEQDKAAIVASIPSDGLSLDAGGGASAMATRVGRWSVHASAFGAARGRLDRQIVELVLYGNAARPDWTFANSEGEALAGWTAGLSHGRAVGHLLGRQIYAGFTLAYVRGLYYARSENPRATLSTQANGLTGAAAADVTTATGGDGLGIDLGLATEMWPHWMASLKLENVIHTIHWNRGIQTRRYDLNFEGVTVDNYDDSLWVSHESVSTRPAFSRGLPMRVRLGLGHTAACVRVAGEFSVSLANRLGGTTTPQIAGGIEYLAAGFLPLRTGVALGGTSGYAVGWGTGLWLGPARFDIGVRIDKAIWIGHGRGMSGALALDLAF